MVDRVAQTKDLAGAMSPRGDWEGVDAFRESIRIPLAWTVIAD